MGGRSRRGFSGERATPGVPRSKVLHGLYQLARQAILPDAGGHSIHPISGPIDQTFSRIGPVPTMRGIVIYQKPTCTTCRKVFAILRDAGVDFTSLDYFSDPIPATKLRELLRKAGLTPRDVLRKNEPRYKELGLAAGVHTDTDLINLMVRYPELLQRPIVERGARAVLACPPERIKELL